MKKIIGSFVFLIFLGLIVLGAFAQEQKPNDYNYNVLRYKVCIDGHLYILVYLTVNKRAIGAALAPLFNEHGKPLKCETKSDKKQEK